MTRINTNVASLRGLRSLNRANGLLNQSLTRLSTGLKINSGKDNPSGLIASETLRSQITAIEQSIKNNNRANNVLSTADSALGEISGLLNQIRGLVQEGLNTGALSHSEIEANQLQIDNALSAINRIAANTTFAGDKLIDGSKSFVTQISTADAAKLSDLKINEAILGSTSSATISAEITSAAQKGTLVYSSGDLLTKTTLEVSGAKGSQALFFDATTNVDDVRDAINAVKDVTGVEAAITTAAVAGTKQLTKVDSNASGANDVITFTEKRVADRTITINFAEGSANSTTSVSSVTTDASNNVTITVELGDAAGVSNATASDIKAAIEGHEEANNLLTVAIAGNDDETILAADDVTIGSADRTLAELTLTSIEYGSDQFVALNVLEGAFASALEDGTAATRDTGSDIVANINGQIAIGKGLQASVKTAALDVSLTFATASNAGGTTATVNITGGGATFQIGQEASVLGQISIGIEAVNTARLGGVSGKLYELGSGGGKSLLDVGNGVQGSDLVGIVEEALSRVNTVRGRIGALQKNVIETTISTLGVALENISEARSEIVDADFAAETAALTRGQILSQAGLSVLGIANQNPSQVLSLLG